MKMSNGMSRSWFCQSSQLDPDRSSGQVVSGQIGSSQVRSGQIEVDRVESSWNKLGEDDGRTNRTCVRQNTSERE